MLYFSVVVLVSSIGLDVEFGVVSYEPVLPELELLDHVAVELLAPLLLPPPQHLQVLLQTPLHLQELLPELRIQSPYLRLPRQHQLPHQVWWLDRHADYPRLHPKKI